MEIFPENNVIQKSWSAKKLFVPPNSAPGLRHCLIARRWRLRNVSEWQHN